MDSTNDGILLEGETQAPEGTTHIARTQIRGRGRSERSWWSPAGAGLWMSTLLRPTRPRADWGGISLLAGAAVRHALERMRFSEIELFWPNDLQARGRKLGGILCEVRSRGDRAWIALGIGINLDLSSPTVRAAMPEEIRSIAISLAELGVGFAPTPRLVPAPRTLAVSILESFHPLYRRFQSGDSVPSLVDDRLAHVGKEVEIRVPGTPPWRGTVQGLGGSGELLVLPRGGGQKPVPVLGGEVIYDPA